eukprot:COSAG02_NODE_3209_length_7165_cov_31.071752_4_plen_37_part_00
MAKLSAGLKVGTMWPLECKHDEQRHGETANQARIKR